MIILCRPERLVDSDVGAREGNMSLGELPMVTRAFDGGAAESETGLDSVAFEVFCMCLVYTPDGVILVSRYCVTCLNLLFSNRRVQIYI